MQHKTTSTEESFLKIDYKLLSNTAHTLSQRILIAYIKGWQVDDKYCIQTQEDIADKLGMSVRTIKDNLVALEAEDVLYVTPAKKVTNKNQYKNRKAIVLIDDKNPAPTKTAKVHENALPLPSHVVAPVQETATPIQETVTVKEESSKWLDLRARYNDEMKYRKGSPLSPAEFHRITKHHFYTDEVNGVVMKYLLKVSITNEDELVAAVKELLAIKNTPVTDATR
jgi:hypothetical protein